MESSVAHRSDIDGLRAIAVLAVIFYHYGADWLPGGFTGVDVFFVISGYIITVRIRQDIEKDAFSLFEFYIRRIKRIYPPLILILIFCLLFGWYFYLTSDYVMLSKSVMFATIGVSNLYFLNNTDYFDPAADTHSLLHTWSLGVEEQFYLVWPITLCIGVRLIRSPILLRLVLVCAAGSAFAYAVWYVGYDPKGAFYLPHARMWELATGAAIAYFPALRSKVATELMTTAGLGLITFGFLTITAQSKFPGMNALCPCLGAALIVWPKVTQGLSSAPLVWWPMRHIGLISYGLYLWHWPLLVFYNHLYLQAPPDLETTAGLLLTTFVLSGISYILLELPIRNAGPAAAWGTVAVCIAIIGASSVIYFGNGLPSRLPDQVVLLAEGVNDYNKRRPQCHRTYEHNPPLDYSCRYGNQSVSSVAAIWSDSHGVELGEAIGNIMEENSESIIGITYSSCPPAMNFKAPLQKGCEKFNESVLRYLLSHPEIKTVYLAAYYEFYLNSDSKNELFPGIELAVRELARAGKRIIIIASNPEMGIRIPQAAAQLAMVGQVETLAISKEEHVKFSASAREFIDNLSKTYAGVEIFDPAEALCDDEMCPMVRDGKPMLFDDNHLSRAGAAIAVQSIPFSAGSP